MKKHTKIIFALTALLLTATAGYAFFRQPEVMEKLLPASAVSPGAAGVLQAAAAEIGYHEKATCDWLDGKTTNSGTENYTKYARDLAAEGYYNGNKNGYAWCDVFVDWCFYRCYGREAAERVECQTGDYGAGCSFSAQYYRDAGRYDDAPCPGDQIFFYENGEIGHTGIVESVNALQVTVIEGNCEDAVRRKIHLRRDPVIAGYGHPRWPESQA